MVTASRSALNNRKDTFAKRMAVNDNRTQAAIDAGYSPVSARNQGQRLMQDDAVLQAIQRYKADIDAVSTVDAAYVIQRLRHFADNSEADANAIRATELLGKTLRMFVDVSESTVTHDVQALASYSDADIVAMLQQAAQAALPAPIETTGTIVPD